MLLPFILLLPSLVHFAQSDGGTVEIQFVRYQNAAHKDNNGYCCESFFTSGCTDNCDNYFAVCYREYNPANDASCIHALTTGEFNDDVTFTTGKNALKNGVDNPFSLDFNGAWKNSFSLKITIKDKDSLSADDLVDVLRPGIANAGISSSWTSLTIRGKHSKTLSLKWRVQCNANYYGDCTVYCVPKDTDVDGHYTCNPTTGAKICRSGWKGAPQCKTPICKTGCSTQNGYCKKPNECICHSGWTGSNCLTCVAKSGCVNGYCINPNECICNSHWLGSLCDKSGNGCKGSPCLNGGTCTVIPDSYTCTCPQDFSGPNCAIDMNRCRSSPCRNNGACSNLPNNFACDCQPGYTGLLCSTEIDECSSDPCLYGNCSDFKNSFSCTCHPGFTGPLCATDIDECASGVNDCGANMLCENTIGGHTCKCQSGYQVALDGLSCILTQCGDFDYLSNATTSVHFSESDRRVNSTASIVCEPGYSMNDGTNSISLRCLDDGSWDGSPVLCKDIDECSKSLDSCDSDEVCHNKEGSYECQRNEPSPTSQTNEPSPTSQTNEPQPTSQPKEPQPTSQLKEPQPTSQPKEPQPTSQPNESQPTSQSSPCSDGETNDCVSDDPNAKNIAAGGSEQTYVYIGIAIGCLLLLIVVVIIVFVACRRHRRALNVSSTHPAMVLGNPVLAAADADHVYDHIVRPGENERLYDIPRSIASQSSRTRLCGEKGVEVGNPLYGFSGMNQPGESNQE